MTTRSQVLLLNSVKTHVSGGGGGFLSQISKTDAVEHVERK